MESFPRSLGLKSHRPCPPPPPSHSLVRLIRLVHIRLVSEEEEKKTVFHTRSSITGPALYGGFSRMKSNGRFVYRYPDQCNDNIQPGAVCVIVRVNAHRVTQEKKRKKRGLGKAK